MLGAPHEGAALMARDHSPWRGVVRAVDANERGELGAVWARQGLALKQAHAEGGQILGRPGRNSMTRKSV